MRFWGSSALLPLLVEEAASKKIKHLFEDAQGIAVWWGTEAECLSVLAQREREGSLTATEQAQAEDLLREVLACAIEVNPSAEIKQIMRRLLRIHALHTAEALQLAAAIALAGENISELTMVTLDERLRLCAQREGLKTLSLE